MLNLQEELNDIEELKKMIIANKTRAINSKDAYLDAHGVKMPYYLRMVVDGNYKTSEALLNNSSFLLDEIQKLNEHISNLEDIIQNGPGSVKPQVEIQSSEPREYTELELKQLSTDGRLD